MYRCDIITILHSRCGELTWHNGTLPAEEVWLKFGGDKGHGSFKFVVQLVNVKNPNSQANTCILAIFKGNDSTANLWTALQQYRDQLEEIDGMEWGYVCMHISIS